MRSKRNLGRAWVLPALPVYPGNRSSRQTSWGYSTCQPVPSCSVSTASRAKARNAG